MYERSQTIACKPIVISNRNIKNEHIKSVLILEFPLIQARR